MKTRKNVSATARTVCDIFNCFDSDRGEAGITDIARILEVYPSKIHRVVTALEGAGLLEKSPVTKKYRIGLRLFEIGSLYPINLDIKRIVRPHALELAKSLASNVHLGIMSRSTPYSIVILDRFINIQSVNSIIHRISFNVPIHSSSLGKALLAFSDPATQRAVLKNIDMQRFTARTITKKATLEAELKLTKKRGYATDRGETHLGVYCIAAPIKDSSGVIAAISVSDIQGKIEKREKEIAERITETADVISYQMGL